ncbi:terpenoid synthase [Apiospora kogelbergensis]|uniref:Terpenoid synthase n=1 Tax=Apiospora kogelbergensis TaxID=1337665 RepID=A0AAW0R240_9PEZI
MEFKYSREVENDLYETDGLNHGIPLRGCLRAQNDWDANVGNIAGYQGGIGDPYSFMAVTLPECLPERLEILAYANEFAFLYDDKLENLDLHGGLDAQSAVHGFLATFDDECFDKTALGRAKAHARPEIRLQSRIFTEMVALDPVRGETSMKAWAEFVQLAARTRVKQYMTLAEYVPARVIDAGEMLWFGFLTFGMALTIPADEYQTCMEMARPGYAVLGLTNDLYSWEKELKAAKQARSNYVFNAIWVIMKEYQADEEEAKGICKQQIRAYMSMFVKVVDRAKGDSTLSRDFRLYLEALLYSCTGNLVWSISCPRYH